MTIENSKQGIIKIINIHNNKEYIMTSIDSRVMKRYYITKAHLNLGVSLTNTNWSYSATVTYTMSKVKMLMDTTYQHKIHNKLF